MKGSGLKILLMICLSIMLTITMMPLGTFAAAESEKSTDDIQMNAEVVNEQTENEEKEDIGKSEEAGLPENTDEQSGAVQEESEANQPSKGNRDVVYVIDVQSIAPTNAFDQDIDLLEGVTVSPDKYMDGDVEKNVLVRVASATPSNTGSQFDSSNDYDPETATLNVKSMDSAGNTRAQVTYTIVYEAYVEGTDIVVATESVDIQFFDDSLIGDLVESDVAYISQAQVLDTIDGTASFDSQDGPGYDSGDHNKIVRTFDTVTTTVELNNAVYDNSDYKLYKKGYVGFEFVLEGDDQKVEFNETYMTWLQTKYADYRIFKNVESGGKKYQIMRGTFLWDSANASQPAIGAANLSFGVSYSVLGMKNGEEIQPDFTFWMVHNDVPDKDTALDDISLDEYAFVKDYADGVAGCDVHERVEPVHIQGDKVQVSAAPWYNVRLSQCTEDTKQLGYWDLASGQYSSSTETDTSIYGRSFVVGATIQIRRPDGHGLKGCELPDGNDITLSLYFDNWHFKGEETGTNYYNPIGTPILWSCEGNSDKSTQLDGRVVPVEKKYATHSPLNKRPGSFNGCFDGGIWQAEQDGEKVNAEISDYQVDLHLSNIPHTYAYSVPDRYVYYDEDIKSVCEVDELCFSAGEFWFIQPFNIYNIVKENGNVVSVTNEGYMPDLVGESGSFIGQLRDGELQMTSESGQSLAECTDNSNQSNKGDDVVNLSVVLEKPGSITTGTGYVEYGKNHYGNKNNPLTPGCGENGLDWIMIGGKLSITSYLSHVQGDTPNMGAAYDQLLKFDNRFFQLEKVRTTGKNTYRGVRVLYAANPDNKSGWDHAGLEPDEDGYDQDMKETEADDLIYYLSLQELEADGYTCVGVLQEVRGVNGEANSNQSAYLVLDGTAIHDESNIDHVFMETIESHAWYKRSVSADISEFYDVTDITDQQYYDYMMNQFPSKLGNGNGGVVKYSEYPDAIWNKQYSKTPGLGLYEKVKYNPDGSVTGSAGTVYGDSCLVVGYTTGINIDCAQSDSNDEEKIAYDMDTGQRVVDYVVQPTISYSKPSESGSGSVYSEYTTQVTIDIVLPEKLTYIPESSYRGGTYEQTGEGRQGNVIGGDPLETIVIDNGNGTTTLRYIFEATIDWNEVDGNTALLDPIYFSCNIGEVGSDNDVNNNEQLTVTAQIESTEDNKREKTFENDNLDEQTIVVSKGAALSLADFAEQVAVDTGDDVAFISKAVNDSNNPRQNAAIVVHIPMDGYNGTHYNGERTIKEFTVPTSGYTVWFTTDTAAYDRDNYSTSEVESGWTQLTINTDGTIDLTGIDTTAITAFAVVGDIPSNGTVEMKTVLEVPEDEAGDYFTHWVSYDRLASYARSFVVKRSIRGVAWVDKNADGLQTSAEMSDNTVAPITVTLLKLKDGEEDASVLSSYEVVKDKNGSEATIPLGKSLDLNSCELTSMSGYQYDFTNMPQGTYALRFNNADSTITSRYRVTDKDVNDNGNDDIDSDATFASRTRSTAVWGTVDGSYIADIELPETETITTSHYVNRYNDLGITVVTYDLSIEKKVTKLEVSTTDPDSDKEFTFTVKVGMSADALSNYSGKYIVTNAEDNTSELVTSNGEIKLKDGETALIKDLEIGTLYKISEETAEQADGFIYATNYNAADSGTINSDTTVVVTNEYKTIEMPVTKSWSGYDGNEEFTATVTLSATVDGAPYTLPAGVETTHTFTSPDEGTYTFEALPAETPDGKEITYSVSETGMTSEGVTISNKSGSYYVYEKTETPHVENGPIYKLLGKWVPSVETTSDGTEIINEWTPATRQEEGTTGFSIRKVDDHGELITTKQATFKVEKKTEDGNELVGEYTTIDGIATIADLDEGDYVITESEPPEGFLDNSASFELSITKELKLKEIKETDLINIFKKFFSFVAGTNTSPYSWDGDKFELTVKNREATEATVEKIWHDGDDALHKRPVSLSFELYQQSGTGGKEPVLDENDEPITVTLPIDGVWQATVGDLPKCDDDGNEITYSWKEDESGLGDDYDLTDTSVSGTKTTFTNTLKTQVTVTKEWRGQNSTASIPTSIIVKLLANDEEKDSVELSGSNNWKHTFGATEDDVLYVYDSDGSKITYSVSEVKVKGYETSVTTSTDETTGYTAFHIVNTYNPGDKDDDKDNGSNTGDKSNILIYLVTMITSLLLMLVLLISYRRRRA